MTQCQARTQAGTRCQRVVAVRSTTLCKAHFDQLQAGRAVRQAATGKRLRPPRQD